MNDDLINRYIDGELSLSEKEEFDKQINSSPGLRKRLEAMQSLHGFLLTQKEESTSADFTMAVMKKITRSSSSLRSQNYFFAAVIGIFSLLCLFITGYLIAGILNSANESSLILPDISVPIISYIEGFTAKAVNLLNPKYFPIIGYLAASLVLLTGYISFENLRSLKKIK
jgi:hypothetical protein